MSINPSSAIAKALSRMAGESFVAFRLARAGWLAVNANGGSQMPNVDILALKGDRRITIQIKAAKADRSIPLAGSYRPDGRYFNGKEGPTADFVVCVMLPRDPNAMPICHVFPVQVAQKFAKGVGERIAGTAKRDGAARSLTFPIWLKGKDVDMAVRYQENWGLLEDLPLKRARGLRAN